MLPQLIGDTPMPPADTSERVLMAGRAMHVEEAAEELVRQELEKIPGEATSLPVPGGEDLLAAVMQSLPKLLQVVQLANKANELLQAQHKFSEQNHRLIHRLESRVVELELQVLAHGWPPVRSDGALGPAKLLKEDLQDGPEQKSERLPAEGLSSPAGATGPTGVPGEPSAPRETSGDGETAT